MPQMSPMLWISLYLYFLLLFILLIMFLYNLIIFNNTINKKKFLNKLIKFNNKW